MICRAWHHGGVDVDDLYGLPLDRFVPERTALARELRNAGERERAGEVAALKKPSVAAWAVNQLVRTQRRAVAELLEAGDALRSAQDDVLAGHGDARSLRAAVERERLAVQKLADAARGLLSSDGQELSETMVERVSDTLHAAALDDDACEQVSAGRLERELRHVGLGGAAFASGSAAPARPVAEKPAARRRSPPPIGPPNAPRARTGSARSASAPRREPRLGQRSARLAGGPNVPSAPPSSRSSAGTRPPRRFARPRPTWTTPKRSCGPPRTRCARPRRRCARRAGSSAQQRDNDHDDHDQHQRRAGERHRTLAPPELGVGAIAGVVALGRGADPVVLVVIRAHSARLECGAIGEIVGKALAGGKREQRRSRLNPADGGWQSPALAPAARRRERRFRTIICR